MWYAFAGELEQFGSKSMIRYQSERYGGSL